MRGAAKNCPRVLAVENDRHVPKETRKNTGTKLARRQSVGFGKLRPELRGLLSPAAAVAFHHHWDECHAFGSTVGLGVKVRTFVPFVSRHSSGRVPNGIADVIHTDATGHCKIKARGDAPEPAGNINVRRPPPLCRLRTLESDTILWLTTDEWPWSQEPRALKFRRQACERAKIVGAITQEIVSLGTITPAATRDAMVPVNVDDAVALRTEVLGVENGNAESALQHQGKQFWAHNVVGVFRRDGVEPPARVWS